MCILGLVSPVNFPSMPVGFMQGTSYLHTQEMQHKQSHKINQLGEGDCYFRTLVVGYSVLSQVPEVCCPCCSCYSAKKPVFHSSWSAPAFSAIRTATQQLSNMNLLCGVEEEVVGKCCTTFSLFQVIYLLPIFHPLKIFCTLDVFSSSYAKLE